MNPFFALLIASSLAAADTMPPLPPLEIATLPEAGITIYPSRDEFAVELPPVDLPANLSHENGHSHGGSKEMEAINPGYPPVSKVSIPRSGAIYGFRVEIVDSAGNRLPDQLLHHLNFIDPFHRELFLPISRRMIAAGKETGSQKLPWLLFGLPVRANQILVLSAMLHNPTPTAYRQVRTRLVLSYTRASRPWPFFEVFPWQLDVLFPVGDKSFDLPPGRSAKSYEARPAISGKIVAVGGHVHEHATRISLTNVTTGEVIWEAAPRFNERGQVSAVPVGRLYKWNRVGAPIRADHTYRVTVEYDNPTGKWLPEGGMGVIGGLFAPDDPSAWPTAQPADALYLQDRGHYLRLWHGRDPQAAKRVKPAVAPADHHGHDH